MRRLLSTVVVVLGSVATMFAQAPVITGVLDAGGYTANIAPGSVFVVKGNNLCGTSQTATAPNYSTAALAGVTIRFTPAGDGSPVDAYMIYTFCSGSTTQLAAELPNATAPGNYNVTVTNNGSTSAAFSATVVARKFGIMTVSGTGSGRGLVQNVVTQTQYDLNAFTSGTVSGAGFNRSPALPGQFLIIWGMGLGAASGFDTAPANYDFIAQQRLDVKVIVGTTQITPAYAGRSNLFPGLDNIVFQLPSPPTLQTGCSVPVQVSLAGQQLSNVVTVAIAANTNALACSDPQLTQDTLTKLDAGANLTVGSFALTSLNTTMTIPGQTGSVSARIESAAGAFTRYTADQIRDVSQFFGTPGACQVFHRTGTTSSILTPPGLGNLDAGVLTLNGPGVTNKPFTESSDKTYSLNLGTAITVPGITLPPGLGFNATPVISQGSYTISGAGGADVQRFNATVNVDAPLTVTGGLPSTINRNNALIIGWTGGGTDNVEIIGFSGAQVGGTSTNPIYDSSEFICTTTADRLSFTVPVSILQQLTATPSNGTGAIMVLSTSAINNTNGRFTAGLTAGGNIDAGLFVATIGTFGTATYQ